MLGSEQMCDGFALKNAAVQKKPYGCTTLSQMRGPMQSNRYVLVDETRHEIYT
jgi:hypothetical protein